jgi:hypothetical protein
MTLRFIQARLACKARSSTPACVKNISNPTARPLEIHHEESVASRRRAANAPTGYASKLRGGQAETTARGYRRSRTQSLATTALKFATFPHAGNQGLRPGIMSKLAQEV